jgi:uncharacterized protein (DUF2235 family)
MNMITFEELRIFARNPHPNLPLIIIPDENGHILNQDDLPVRTPRGRQAIALADVTYKDGRQANRSAKSHHHPYPQTASNLTHQPVQPGNNTKAADKTCSSPPKHRFAQLNIRYNFDDVSSAVPQIASERGARSNLASRKAIKNQKIVAAIFADEINENSKGASARKTSGHRDILLGWT